MQMMKSTPMKRTRTLSFDVLAGKTLPKFQTAMIHKFQDGLAIPADMIRGMSRPTPPPYNDATDAMDAMAWAMSTLFVGPAGCLVVKEEYDT